MFSIKKTIIFSDKKQSIAFDQHKTEIEQMVALKSRNKQARRVKPGNTTNSKKNEDNQDNKPTSSYKRKFWPI